MKQIEITVKVYQKLEEVDNILKTQGFQVIRESRIEDKYLIRKDQEINLNNIIDVLSKAVLVRYLNVSGDQIFKKITYKNKKYNGKTVISEEKINVNIDNIDNAVKLFEQLDYKKIADVNYDVIVYEKNGIELAFQNVENLGLLLEYENLNDFDGCSDENIISEKKSMLEELQKYGLNISDDYDIKKAYEIIRKMLLGE